jgi:hypothetical protein
MRLDLIGSSAVTIRDYGTIVHKCKLILELMQGGFPTNRPPWWLALGACRNSFFVFLSAIVPDLDFLKIGFRFVFLKSCAVNKNRLFLPFLFSEWIPPQVWMGGNNHEAMAMMTAAVTMRGGRWCQYNDVTISHNEVKSHEWQQWLRWQTRGCSGSCVC